MIFDELIKFYTVKHVDTDDPDIALTTLITEKDKIISFNGSTVLNEGNTVIFFRDYITDIKTDGTLLYYVIDNEEFPVFDDTRLFTFLSPLKPILFKSLKPQVIKFKRWYLPTELTDSMSTQTIKEKKQLYYYGEIHNDY